MNKQKLEKLRKSISEAIKATEQALEVSINLNRSTLIRAALDNLEDSLAHVEEAIREVEK